MTGTPSARIPRADLILGRPLGDGGQGTVCEVDKRLINKTWPVAYKEYKPKALEDLRVDVLERMVAFLPGLPASDGEWMARHTAWPAALVTQGARVQGFLMRQIPDEFFLTLPSGDRKAAGFEFLLNPLTYVRDHVGEVTPRQTLGLLLALADMLGRLHGLGVAAGDLSPKNLLFSLAGPRPGCFLIDCDAMVLEGDWALTPAHTPSWQLPAGERPGTKAGDVYKFALLAARLFLHEQQGQDVGPLRWFAPVVGDLAARALKGRPADRPALDEWLDPLRHAYDTAPDTWTTPSPDPTGPAPAGPAAGSPSTGGAGAPYPAGGPAAPVGGQPPAAGGVHVTTSAPSAGSQGSAWAGCVVAAALLIVVVVGLVHQFGGSDAPDTDSGTGGAPQTSQQETRSADSRQAQAAALEELLTQNSGRRGSVADAVRSMTDCVDLPSAQGVFAEAAQSRADLVEKLGGLDLGELPDGMADGLREAWQSSEEADRAYARVADEVSGDCTPGAVTNSASWQDAADASADATKAKKDFVADWNPLAEQYGLTTFVWTDL